MHPMLTIAENLVASLARSRDRSRRVCRERERKNIGGSRAVRASSPEFMSGGVKRVMRSALKRGRPENAAAPLSRVKVGLID